MAEILTMATHWDHLGALSNLPARPHPMGIKSLGMCAKQWCAEVCWESTVHFSGILWNHCYTVGNLKLVRVREIAKQQFHAPAGELVVRHLATWHHWFQTIVLLVNEKQRISAGKLREALSTGCTLGNGRRSIPEGSSWWTRLGGEWMDKVQGKRCIVD